ncbi:MAG: efflux transporter outer membrane subunit [Candidatus Hydrogenedentes bacterium]|nr:efflux transporter outer membrane subunit [Candidatus Hydrogenedentota bacterium]
MPRHYMMALVLAGGVLAGCKTGPDYVRPNVDVPSKWSSAREGGEADKPAAVTEWWTTLNDPVLNDLIGRSVEANFDLRMAEARVREARAARGIVAADLWPNVGISGSYAHSQSTESKSQSGGVATTLGAGLSPLGVNRNVTLRNQNASVTRSVTGFGAGAARATSVSLTPNSSQTPGRTSDLFQAWFDASWELDIFGGNRRAVEAADATIDAAEDARRGVVLSLLSEVALNYIDLRATQSRLAITHKNIAAQAASVTLTRDRFQAGLTSELDAVRAESLLATTQSQLPALESHIQGAIHGLGVLMGKDPGALLEELSTAAPMPAAPGEVPVGLPSDLLRRRPDIRQSERELAAATARIGEAMADLFPKFSLTGAFGGKSGDLGNVFSNANQLWSLGSTVRWPLFDAGRIRANINVQNARQEQAAIAYEKSIMTALEDVENALVAFAKEQVRRDLLDKAVKANEHAVRLANERYVQGLESFLSVLTAQQQLFQTEDQLVQSQSFVLTDLVSLYKALGGGWETHEPQEPDTAKSKPTR